MEAGRQARLGQEQSAEELFRNAVEGFQYLLGPTHEESIKVVHALATFYMENDRATDAYKLIEKSTRLHVERLGIEDRKTQQHIMHVAELMNGWNRGDDALVFLARARELSDGNGRISRKNRGRSKSQKTPQESSSQQGLLRRTQQSISADSDLSQLDYGLDVARNHFYNKDESGSASVEDH